MQNTRATQGLGHFEHTSKTEYMVSSHAVGMQDWTEEADDNLTLTGNTRPYLRIMKKWS